MMHMNDGLLAKDILSNNRECQDMHMKLFEATVTNSGLIDQISQLALENQQLRLQMLAIQEENDELHSQLSYPSQRWMHGGGYSGCKRWYHGESATEGETESPAGSPESWEEVSQKLLNQMKQEMKEMEDLGQRLAVENSMATESTYQDSDPVSNVKNAASVDDGSNDVDLERVRLLIQGLKGQSEHLKNQLLSQSVILQTSLNQLKKATRSGAVIITRKSGASIAINGDLSKNKFDRPSDELFRAYFTQQLHNSSGSQPCQRSSDDEERHNPDETKDKPFEEGSRGAREHSPEEKICPVCEASFPCEMPLEEFQNHVMDHFENDNSTLLQQYELL